MLAAAGSLFLALVCTDMGIRQYIEDTYQEREEHETILGRVVLRKVYNKGFLLNTLEDRPEIVKGASAAAGAGVLVYDVWLFLRKGRIFRKLGMVFLSAGAFGNVFDRLVRGKVIDYIGIKSKSKHLSRLTANLADFYAVAGAVIVAVTGWGKR